MAKKPSNSPTMKDVAREAGVALGTVSKVFNGIPVGEDYRKRVEAAAKMLGYQVNNYARGLKTNKTYTVALILPSIANPFFGRLANEVCYTLHKLGYRMIMATTYFNPQAEMECIQMVRQNKVDGIIALTYNPELEIADDLPFVSIDRYMGPRIPCVTSDNFGGGQLAAEKLTELGCKKPVFLRIGSETPGEPDKRGAGFESWCMAKGVDYTVLKLKDDDGLQPFYDFLTEHCHDGKLDFDGIFCNTDVMCYRVCNHLRSLGVRIPEDVQLIGFDGIHLFNEEFEGYHCSTIVQPVRQIAETAVNVLLNKNDTHPALMCLPVEYAKGPTTRD